MSGLYIHIPFCHSKCAYCDFYSTPNTSTLESISQAIATEWNLRKDEIPTPSTLYLGGGTPSILPPEHLTTIVNAIGCHTWLEATIECNPEDVTPAWLDLVKSLGFTRISMGIQSLDDEQLRVIGRRHNAQQAIDAAELIAGSELDYSLDLIYGLPGQDLASWEDSLRRTIALHPDHLSCYLLSYEEGTKLWAMRERGKVVETDEDTVRQMYNHLCTTAVANGYEHYEVSNFARSGHRAIHNSNYWSGEPYLGLGPSAHSFDGKVRRINPSSTKQYLNSLCNNEIAATTEDESDLDRLNDTIITRLRTVDGISIADDIMPYGQAAANRFLCDVQELMNQELIIRSDLAGRLSIPEEHWLVSDAILRSLIQI